MLISCPSCHARYNVPDNRLVAEGLAVACASCGHNWIERPTIEARAIEVYDVTPQAAPMRTLPAVIEPGPDADLEVRRLMEASRHAQEAFKEKRRKKLKALRNWAILGCFTLSPIAAAAAFPVQVVQLVPITIKAYEKIGYEVNVYGLEIHKVEEQHAIVDGTRILTVKGEISNIAGSDRKIPWLRFGLTDQGAKEVYSWTLDTGARPLHPGETTNFVTRVASPPESAKNLQIRFAHAEEISSKP